MKLFSKIFIILFFFSQTTFAEIIKKIEVSGNKRIPYETVIMFSDVKINEDIKYSQLNEILKNLYESNFFEDISVNLSDNILKISVVEFPIIENIIYKGIKAKKIEEEIKKNLILRPRSSFNKAIYKEDQEKIISTLKSLGFYFSELKSYVEELEDNRVNIINEIDLGKKAKIKKITFIGNKKFKDRKLRNVIISEEYKFWKFISGKKYLNTNLINLDNRLLKNFYLNQGFYNVKVNSTFARLLSDDSFELIFNIEANNKYYFGDLSISLPNDFQPNNYEEINNLFDDFKGKPYSINSVEKILNTIDLITTNDEFKSINAFVDENISDQNKINLNFIIEESEKFLVERIDIFGNNVTRENVIRN